MTDSLKLSIFILSRWAVLATATVLTLVHPLIHGTPLDSGMLDAWLAAAQVTALTQR